VQALLRILLKARRQKRVDRRWEFSRQQANLVRSCEQTIGAINDQRLAWEASARRDLIDLAVELGLVKKMGAFFSYGELRLGQGRENSKAYLRENPSLADQLEREIRDSSSPAPVPVHAGAAEDEEAE